MPGDYAAVSALATELFELAADRQAAFAALLAHPDRALVVAEARGEVVGYADLLTYPDLMHGRRAGELLGLIVKPDHRGRGLGRALLEAARRVACEQGAGELHINTETENEVAVRLYSSCGARAIGIHMEMDLQSEEA